MNYFLAIGFVLVAVGLIIALTTDNLLLLGIGFGVEFIVAIIDIIKIERENTL